jgi:hypothetical protein
MEELFGQLVLGILQGFFEVVCYFTAKWLLPLVSRGRLQVLAPLPPRKWWSIRSFTKLPNGQIGVYAEMATLLGVIFWLIVMVGGMILYDKAGHPGLPAHQ